MDPTRLFERASQGDHEAFGMLVGEHLARLDTAARARILRDPELARDAVQEATLRAWKNLRGLRDPGRLGAWLHRLTVNACLDIARKRRGRMVEVSSTPLHDAPVADPTSRVVVHALRRTNARPSTPPSARSSCCTTTSTSRFPRPLPRSASRWGRPSPGLNRALDAMRIRVADENELPAQATAMERFA